MMIKALKDKLDVKNWFSNKSWRLNRWLVVAFLLAFGIMFTFIDITLNRNALVRSFKDGISMVIKDLNELGLDVAYESLEFDNIFIYPLLKINKLSIYNLKGERLWQINIDEVSARPSLWGWKKINFTSESGIRLILGDKTWELSTGDAELVWTLQKKYDFKSAELYLKDIAIKDFAKIKNITTVIRKTEKNVK